MKTAIFIDRDGTINPDPNGYISSPADFEIYDFVNDAFACADDSYLFLVSNQSGIARGYFDFEDLEKVHHKMNNLLIKQFDEIFVSPYHPEGNVEKYAKISDDRKPNIGLFEKALKKYKFDIKHSFMIGDNMSDIEFGYNAGLQTILVLTGKGNKIFQDRKNWKVKPDFVVKNLLIAMKLIQKINKNIRQN